MPASSWGAYIITIIGGILVSHGITEYSALSAFMQLAPMNFYAVFAIINGICCCLGSKIDVGPMLKQELAASHGHGFDEGDDDSQAKDLNDELEIEESQNGRVADLVMPIVALIAATFFFLIFTGYQALAADGVAFNLLGAFENTDVGTSLCYGGLIGLIAALDPCYSSGNSGFASNAYFMDWCEIIVWCHLNSVVRLEYR